jgi:hypothetical protein
MGQTIGSSWAKSESQHNLAEVRFAPQAFIPLLRTMRLSHEFAAPRLSHSVDFSASSSLIMPTSLIRMIAE